LCGKLIKKNYSKIYKLLQDVKSQKNNEKDFRRTQKLCKSSSFYKKINPSSAYEN